MCHSPPELEMLHRRLGLLAFVLLFIGVAPRVRAAEMAIHVDASDAPRKRLQAHLVIPAKPGPLTLCYPKWIAGEHGPTGPVADLVEVKIQAGGKPVPWQRDAVDMYAFNLTVPAGATELEVDVEFITSPNVEGSSPAASITPQMAVLNWNQVLLYPKDSVIQTTTIAPSLTLPKDWKMGSALKIAHTDAGGTIRFQPVTLERLCDSPVISGRFYKEVALGPDEGPKHFLCLAADSEAALALSPELKAKYDRLVAEAYALFGARHYNSYQFLLALSDRVGHFGLEHHESSDDRVSERTLIDPAFFKNSRASLLPHEYVHSWNGKYRRPAEMVVGSFQTPVRTNRLWVYEGLTEYLGFVLAVQQWIDDSGSVARQLCAYCRVVVEPGGTRLALRSRTRPSPPRICTVREPMARRAAAAWISTTRGP